MTCGRAPCGVRNVGRRLSRRTGVRGAQEGLRTAEQIPSAEADPTAGGFTRLGRCRGVCSGGPIFSEAVEVEDHEYGEEEDRSGDQGEDDKCPFFRGGQRTFFGWGHALPAP